MSSIETDDNKIIAIIPARGGSKRIKHKNTKLFSGRPLIEYAIILAQRSKLFDRIIVSTDSEFISDIAVQLGAEVPFVRPNHISDDFSTTSQVVEHTLLNIGPLDRYDFACCIYPAVPFIKPDDLERSSELIVESSARTVLSVASYPAPIQRAFKHSPSGELEMIWPENRDVRSNDLVETFHDIGQFYWFSISEFLLDPILLTSNIRGYQIPRWRAHDLDTNEDWKRAELIYESLRSNLHE